MSLNGEDAAAAVAEVVDSGSGQCSGQPWSVPSCVCVRAVTWSGQEFSPKCKFVRLADRSFTSRSTGLGLT